MALNGLYSAKVPLRNYSHTHCVSVTNHSLESTHRVGPSTKDGTVLPPSKYIKKLNTTNCSVFTRWQHRLSHQAMVKNPSILSWIQMLIMISVQGWHFTGVKLVLPSPVGLTRFKPDKTGLKWAKLGKIYTT